MAKNSVEKKIREVLHERTMAPSENAWSKIENELGSPSEANKKRYWVYGIAAGFIGILFVSIFFISQPGAEVNPTQELVDTEDTKVDVSNTLEILESIVEQPENTAEMVHKDPLQEKTQLTDEILTRQAERPKLRDEKMMEDFVSLEKVDTKIAEVMTQVTMLEQTQGTVSDATIDSLLRMAQRELLGEEMLGKPQKVDALALLSEVENELNRSLRDQLFDKLKNGYVKVRSAIAYRNE